MVVFAHVGKGTCQWEQVAVCTAVSLCICLHLCHWMCVAGVSLDVHLCSVSLCVLQKRCSQDNLPGSQTLRICFKLQLLSGKTFGCLHSQQQTVSGHHQPLGVHLRLKDPMLQISHPAPGPILLLGKCIQSAGDLERQWKPALPAACSRRFLCTCRWHGPPVSSLSHPYWASALWGTTPG